VGMARTGDIDPDAAHPAIARARQILAHYSDKSFVIWFNNPSSFLDGKRPRDVLDSDPERVVAQAQYMYDAEFFAG
jgi:hypothetical protein